MDKILRNSILSSLKKEIIENKKEIENISLIDIKYCKMKIDIDEFANIIEHYKNREFTCKKRELSIYCNGNPNIILNLIMIAICSNFSIKFNIDNCMMGVNTCILSIVNNIMRKNSMDISFEICKNANSEEAIFIDRINDYNISKSKMKKMKYIPYEAIDVFCDCEDYSELLMNVYDYALNMNIDIELFDKEEGIESVFEFGNAKKILFLTKQKINVNCSNKKVYLNENPFKDGDKIFDEKMINLIVE